MSQIFNFARDANGYNAYVLTPPQDTWQVQLAANTEKTFTVPSNYPYWILAFSYETGTRTFLAYNATAVLPTGTATTGGSVLTPAGWSVKAGDVIHLITPDTNAYVSVSMYYRDWT